MGKFQNHYHAESNKMPGWEYSRNGYYFVTPVLLGFKCYFGTIENGRMILSDFGKIALEEWHKSFEIRYELFLDEFILMPNHLHAILIIKNPENISPGKIGNVQTHSLPRLIGGRASLTSPESPESQSAKINYSARQNLFHHSGLASNRQPHQKLMISLIFIIFPYRNSIEIIACGKPVTTTISSETTMNIGALKCILKTIRKTGILTNSNHTFKPPKYAQTFMESQS